MDCSVTLYDHTSGGSLPYISTCSVVVFVELVVPSAVETAWAVPSASVGRVTKWWAGPPFFSWQILPNSAVQFVKFCKTLQHYYPQMLYILQPVGVVVLTDNTSLYKEFIVTCNKKTHYSRPLIMNIHIIILLIIIKVSLQWLNFIVL